MATIYLHPAACRTRTIIKLERETGHTVEFSGKYAVLVPLVPDTAEQPGNTIFNFFKARLNP